MINNLELLGFERKLFKWSAELSSKEVKIDQSVAMADNNCMNAVDETSSNQLSLS